jgi:hypothetical protein
MKGWRGLWYPERSWTVPPYRTLEFWATYVLWLTAIEVFAAAVLKHPESLSLGEKFLFVTVLVGPICAALGPLKSHARIRRGLRASPDFVSSAAGKDFLKHAAAIRLQILFLVISLEAFVSLLVQRPG